MSISSNWRAVACLAATFCLFSLAAMNARGDVRGTEALPPDPIEAYWDPLPLDPGLTIQPVLKSRYGDVIVRGRKEDNGSYVVNLSTTDCKQPNGASIHVITVGKMPEDICKHVEPVKPGEMNSKSFRDGDTLLGRSSGWVLVEFEQKIQGLTYTGRVPSYETKFEGHWSLTATGAAVRFENGHRVVYAPGETVKIDGEDFLIETVMTKDKIDWLNNIVIWMSHSKELASLLKEGSKESVADIIERAKREGAEVTIVEPVKKPAIATQQPTKPTPEKTARREPPTWMKILSRTLLIGIPLGLIYGLYRLAKWLWTLRKSTAVSKS